MNRFAPTTLAEMMGEAGMADADERLRWMLLTWDLGVPDAPRGRYYRYFTTLDCYLTSFGNRTQAVFTTDVTDKKPLRGRRSKFTYRAESALHDALDATAVYLNAGHTMICRPLAVDLSSMAGEPLVSGFAAAAGVSTAPGAGTRMDAGDAGDLLMEMGIDSPTGREALAEINRVRADARGTHLDPGWTSSFPGSDATDLWLGR